jgi:hypothetical protein
VTGVQTVLFRSQARRSQHMTVTVGMWEDMLNKIHELEERIDNRY